MRLLVLLLALLLSGCAGVPSTNLPAPEPVRCEAGDTTLWFGPGHTLLPEAPAAGSQFSNGFDEAFLVDEMDEWHSAPFVQSMRIEGNLTLEYWVRNHGTPAPVVIGGDPGEGYHWFNQIGTSGGFVPDYGREYAEATPTPGSVHHYVEVIAMPPGGLHVEDGDHLRVLLTSLVADDDQARGQEILFGGDTPSQVRFTSHCMPDLDWTELHTSTMTVRLRGNQGLITGAVPEHESNTARVGFSLEPLTQKLTIAIRQTSDPNPLKDDIDLAVLDASGQEIASIGSPYSDETGTFYAANLAHMMPPGSYTVQVNSYSGIGYEGRLTILQETATLSSDGDSAQP